MLPTGGEQNLTRGFLHLAGGEPNRRSRSDPNERPASGVGALDDRRALELPRPAEVSLPWRFARPVFGPPITKDHTKWSVAAAGHNPTRLVAYFTLLATRTA